MTVTPPQLLPVWRDGNTCCYIHNSVYHNATSLLLLSFQLTLPVQEVADLEPAGLHLSFYNLHIYVAMLLMPGFIKAGQTPTVLVCLHLIIELHRELR